MKQKITDAEAFEAARGIGGRRNDEGRSRASRAESGKMVHEK